MTRTMPACVSLCAILVLGSPSLFAAEPPVFVRGINLHGPAVTIDGRPWEGRESPHYQSSDQAFENQKVPLIPETDADRARMIRSSRWGNVAITLTGLTPGGYSLFAYVWEDNNSESFRIAVNGRTVVEKFDSGRAGAWERLGPWNVEVDDQSKGALRITSQGGAANFSGIELWSGEHAGAAVADITPEQEQFFESRIRPVLVKHCYECHSADSQELQGGLLVDSRQGLRTGGDSGPAVAPGDLERSLLIAAVRYSAKLQMPPSGRLAAREVADLEAWVSEGAPDPRIHARAWVKKKFDVAQARQFWSLQPITTPPLPQVRATELPFSDIDQFLLAELEQRALPLQPLADKRTLLRRATYDLTGFPPTVQELRSFLEDRSPSAFCAVIDRLLASPHYGERWGRHWMDLVRYADTAGDNSDYPVPQLFRYRNYLIEAFNADKPYDEFLREQIAGDLLPAADDAQRNSQVIATGYLASARRFGSVTKDYPQHLTIEDTIENLGRTVLGLSISCARCHDHKFDPISQEDYYALYGIFNSMRYPFPGIELDKTPRDFVPLLENGRPSEALAYAVMDVSRPGDVPLQIRGEPNKPGDVVPRRFLEVLGGQTLPEDALGTSGRRQLAEWLTDPGNPLTARVMVNRIWQHHFGAGLVKSVSDFGVRGTPPTHPQLLDHLASTFIADGWSIKQMHRRMMLSRAYQLASHDDFANLQRDPGNDWHWRYVRRRLDAESLRDTLLFLSGELDPSMMNEPHPFPPVDKWGFTQHHPFRETYHSRRRSVYLMTARLNSLSFFTTFDGADRNATTPKRDSSVTSVQALYLLNNAEFHKAAELFARRLIAMEADPSRRLNLAFEMATSHLPQEAEHAALLDWISEIRTELSEGTAHQGEELEAQTWASVLRVLLRTNSFLYVD